MISRCVHPPPNALRGLFLDWLSMVAPSREACESGRSGNEERSMVQLKLAPFGPCWGKELP